MFCKELKASLSFSFAFHVGDDAAAAAVAGLEHGAHQVSGS